MVHLANRTVAAFGGELQCKVKYFHFFLLTFLPDRGDDCDSGNLGALGVGRLSSEDTVFILLHGNAKVLQLVQWCLIGFLIVR